MNVKLLVDFDRLLTELFIVIKSQQQAMTQYQCVLLFISSKPGHSKWNRTYILGSYSNIGGYCTFPGYRGFPQRLSRIGWNVLGQILILVYCIEYCVLYWFCCNKSVIFLDFM